jgi:glycosyltransferase involved in cell wall biosynthesis
MGIPMIATDVGDLGNLVKKYNIGLVVPPNNPDAITDALRIVIKKAKDSYQKGLSTAQKEISIEKSVDKVSEALKKTRLGSSP